MLISIFGLVRGGGPPPRPPPIFFFWESQNQYNFGNVFGGKTGVQILRAILIKAGNKNVGPPEKITTLWFKLP